MSRAWMPLYVADYLADTGHLSAAEHGAYLLLIMHYWSNGGLPDDDRKLGRIARMTPEEWAEARDTIADFFQDGWTHRRIDKELSDAKAAYDRRAAAGRKGGKATQEGKQCLSNAQPMLKQSQSQSDILSSNEDKNTREARLSSVRQSFSRFWTAWPHKVGKPAAERAFGKVADEADAIVAGVERYIRDKPPDRPWLNPATFLNQRRWEDAPAESSVVRMQPKERDLRNVPDALLSADDYWKKRRQQREWA